MYSLLLYRFEDEIRVHASDLQRRGSYDSGPRILSTLSLGAKRGFRMYFIYASFSSYLVIISLEGLDMPAT